MEALRGKVEMSVQALLIVALIVWCFLLLLFTFTILTSPHAPLSFPTLTSLTFTPSISFIFSFLSLPFLFLLLIFSLFLHLPEISLHYNNGQFLACVEGNNVFVSDDGMNFKEVDLGFEISSKVYLPPYYASFVFPFFLFVS